MTLQGRPAVVGVALAAGLSLACIAVDCVLGSLALPAGGVAFVALSALLGSVSIAAAWLVARRRPRSIIAVLLALLGLYPNLSGLADTYGNTWQLAPDQVPMSAWFPTLTQGAWMFWFVIPALLVLVFPDGHLVSRRWRTVLVALIAVPFVFVLSGVATPGRFEPPFEHLAAPVPAPPSAVVAVLVTVDLLCLLGLLASLVLSVISAVIRFRRSDHLVRAQMKWFLLGATSIPATLLLGWFSYFAVGDADLVVVGLIVIYLSIPVSTMIAVLRHDLYDVDRALSASTTYLLVTAALLAIYTSASVVGGLALGHRSPAVAAAATAVCAAALSPLLRALRTRVDRKLYPSRRRVLDALDHLQHQIHAGAAKPEQVGPVLADALGGKVRVGFRLPGSEVEVDADEKSIPAPAVDDIVVPVVLGDERVGVLVADQVSSRQLLREAADAAALLFEMVRLRTGLSRAVRDVESSRARLLRAGYDERHRLERDLHDGAQQRLVSLGMSLRMAQRHLTDGTIDLDGLLDDAVDQLGSAVAELRQIAHGLRPSTLDDGLGPALATLIERLPVPVVLDLTAGTVPETTATTAYFVASEAVTNAVKHASAARIDLAVWQVGDQLNVRVTDDGRGGAQVRPGAGLAGLTDRVAAAGGRLRVDSTAYRGTVIEAVLPCAS